MVASPPFTMEHAARKGRFARAVAAFALGFVLLELGWRAYLFELAPPERQGKFARLDQMPESAFRFRPHPHLVYALNERFVSADGKNRHNGHGTRGPDFVVPKPAGVVRIVCIGGSTTYETGVKDDAETYPAKMGELLRTRHGRADVEVINAGVPGYTSFESLILLALRALEWQPDYVLYYDNTNDVHPRLVEPAVFASDDAGYRKPWDDDVRWWDHSLVVRWLGVQMGFSPRNALVDRATREENQARDKADALARNSPQWFRRNLEEMSALCAARGSKLVLASWASCPSKGDFAGEELYQRAFRENNAVLAEVARSNKLPWFDFEPAMSKDPELWADGAHVNERGAALKAELFARFVAEHVLGRR
ncbi:MAG: SGNH/GDSL hydrolase family protein [Planctomycetes bacterium]|nr:SGNH/GDSL hydrolase family protein [Planctomycetota bacterium]